MLFWSSHSKDLALKLEPALPAPTLAVLTLVKKIELQCHFEHRLCICPHLPQHDFDVYQLVVPRQYLCTVSGIAHARGIPKRQSGQVCNSFGSLSAVQSLSFVLPGLCILSTLPYDLTPHRHVLSCMTQKPALLGGSTAFTIFKTLKKIRKEHKCYGILRLFILRNNIYSHNTKQSFTMFSLVVYIQHTPRVITWCASLQTSGFPTFQSCLYLLVLK